MWRREREPDALARYRASQAERAAGTAANERPDPAADLGRFTSGLPAARPTTAGERHAFAVAQKADRRSTARFIRRYAIHLTIGVLALAGGYLAAHRESDHAPKVGECAKHGSDHKLVTVACSDDSAEFRVTSRVDDTDDGDSACADDVEATTSYAYSSTGAGLKFVLCLAPR